MRDLHIKDETLWIVMWRSNSCLDGFKTHPLRSNRVIQTFRTRREARVFAQQCLGYIKHRPDLRRQPHGWMMPQSVKVKVTMRAA